MNLPSTYEDVVALTQKLVSIPSVNPVLADDPSVSGEHRLAEFISDYLRKRGFRIDFHEAIQGRPNVVGTFGPSHPRRRIIIEAHSDTQGIHGMTVDPFRNEVRNGRIYGRGACDMKGPMAAALVNLTSDMLRRLADAGVQLTFIAAVGEETGNLGALELVDAGIGADEILVLEPTDLHIVHAHKGVFWFEVEVKGLAAHGSNPDKGISAVRGMSRVIEMLYQQTADITLRNDILGQPTVNVGIIRGGTSINIVPDRCVIEVDRRMLPDEDSDRILANVREGIAVLVAEGHLEKGTARRIKEGVPFATTTESRLVKRLGTACAECDVEAVTEGAAWYSDAGPFSKTCREVAVFGPGSIRQAHTEDEYIEITELMKGADIIQSFLRNTAREFH